MSKAWIVVDAEVDEAGNFISTAPAIAQMVAALKQAALSKPSQQVKVISTTALAGSEPIPSNVSKPDIAIELASSHIQTPLKTRPVPWVEVAGHLLSDVILCPLTLNLPPDVRFQTHAAFCRGDVLYRICRSVETLQRWVQQQFGCLIGSGQYWLPIAHTAKGSLYAEVIGLSDTAQRASMIPAAPTKKIHYAQPLHLSDFWRQPLYFLAQRLLRSLNAPPAIYLLQFGMQNDQICFDRLIPFPAEPAIASLGVQTPDLFTCHWFCLTATPLTDIFILPNG